jgi:hypothetical protein
MASTPPPTQSNLTDPIEVERITLPERLRKLATTHGSQISPGQLASWIVMSL